MARGRGVKKEIGARTARPDDYWIGKGNLLLDVILYLVGGNHLFGEDVGAGLGGFHHLDDLGVGTGLAGLEGCNCFLCHS